MLRKCKQKWSLISDKHYCKAVRCNRIKGLAEIPWDEVMSLLSEYKYLVKLVLWSDSLLEQKTQTTLLNVKLF